MNFISKLFRAKNPINRPPAYLESRSSKWTKLRNEYIKNNPRCVCCGKIVNLNVHHIKPFHLYPELELDIYNLMTLCENTDMNCHFVQGHMMDWTAWNPSVVNDTRSYKTKLDNKIFTRLPSDD